MMDNSDKNKLMKQFLEATEDLDFLVNEWITLQNIHPIIIQYILISGAEKVAIALEETFKIKPEDMDVLDSLMHTSVKTLWKIRDRKE